MTDMTCDVAVIGAGTSGLAAERSARRAGASTLLIDPAFAGTTCARVGCMPSKLLIAAGNAAHATRSASAFGVRAADPDIDGRAVMERVRRLRDRFVADTLEGIDALPDGIAVLATARFTGATRLALSDGRSVAARAVVIATGARPSIPDAFETVRDAMLTNETVFEIDDLPASLAVIGSGAIGIELAQAFARLGVEVAMFDHSETLGASTDAPVAIALRQILSAEFPIRLGVELEAVPADGGVRLAWSGAENGSQTFAKVLVAAGRPPALDGLDLQKTGLVLDEHGKPEFDRETLRCGDAPIFIAGDAAADRPVLHEVSSEGAIAGRNAASYPTVSPGHRWVPFTIAFCDPQVVAIGDVSGERATIGEASYDSQGRALAMDTAHGVARLFAHPHDGRLIGASLVTPAAEHLGHLLAWNIERGITATEMLDLPFYHPTYEEGLKAALRAICEAVGKPPPADRDEGRPPGG